MGHIFLDYRLAVIIVGGGIVVVVAVVFCVVAVTVVGGVVVVITVDGGVVSVIITVGRGVVLCVVVVVGGESIKDNDIDGLVAVVGYLSIAVRIGGGGVVAVDGGVANGKDGIDGVGGDIKYGAINDIEDGASAVAAVVGGTLVNDGNAETLAW